MTVSSLPILYHILDENVKEKSTGKGILSICLLPFRNPAGQLLYKKPAVPVEIGGVATPYLSQGVTDGGPEPPPRSYPVKQPCTATSSAHKNIIPQEVMLCLYIKTKQGAHGTANFATQTGKALGKRLQNVDLARDERQRSGKRNIYARPLEPLI
jgi:hypothetical protein